jgi:hypothetical protein
VAETAVFYVAIFAVFYFTANSYKTRSLPSNQAEKKKFLALLTDFSIPGWRWFVAFYNISMGLINVIRNKYLTLLVGGC